MMFDPSRKCQRKDCPHGGAVQRHQEDYICIAKPVLPSIKKNPRPGYYHLDCYTVVVTQNLLSTITLEWPDGSTAKITGKRLFRATKEVQP